MSLSFRIISVIALGFWTIVNVACGSGQLQSQTKHEAASVPAPAPEQAPVEDTVFEKLKVQFLDSAKKKQGVVNFEETKKGLNISFESDLLKKGSYHLFVMDSCDSPRAEALSLAVASFSSQEGGQYYTEHTKDNLFLVREGQESINGKFVLLARQNASGKAKFALVACAKIVL